MRAEKVTNIQYALYKIGNHEQKGAHRAIHACGGLGVVFTPQTEKMNPLRCGHYLRQMSCKIDHFPTQNFLAGHLCTGLYEEGHKR